MNEKIFLLSAIIVLMQYLVICWALTAANHNYTINQITQRYARQLSQTSTSNVTSLYPRPTLTFYSSLRHPTITNLNHPYLWHIEKDKLLKLINTQLIIVYIISFLHNWISIIVLCQLALTISFTPLTPILLTAKFKYFYVSRCEILPSIVPWTNGTLPTNLFHFYLSTTAFT